MKKNILEKWTYKDSAELYGIRYWGNRYFSISEKGEVTVSLQDSGEKKTISILSIINEMRERGLSMPILLRFQNLLNDRLKLIHNTFSKAIKENGYTNVYKGVYPIKVNQQEEVIKEITESGKVFHHGLEAGSKAELIAALAYMHDPEAYLICNGYKDKEFIDIALFALKMGIQVILVIERPEELPMIIERSQAINIKPRVGIRIKLSTRASGHWTDSGGDKSVFGLTTAQTIRVIEYLKANEMLDCLELLHYHLGSQITNIQDIRAAITEACRYYIALCREGAKMGILDIGGGLAVDYDGSQTNFGSSKNYTIDEYCGDIIEGIVSTMKESNVPHPVLVSETGRAIVAYYSVLLFNILDVNRFEYEEIIDSGEESNEYLQNLEEILKGISQKNIQEYYHDSLYYRDKIRSDFIHGISSLRERGKAESLFWNIVKKIVEIVKKMRYVPDELIELEENLVDIYYGNFSLFQSIPDAWAIDQLFPIMPIQRLNEEPQFPAIIADTTCDCDGKITKFIDLRDIKKFLPLHDLDDHKDYILGVFLVGAYQETLGDLHNLFGDTNVVSIYLDDEGEIDFSRELAGDSIADVLSYVEYDPKELVNRFRILAEKAIRKCHITPQERHKIMNMYETCMRGYTYFKKE
ncbi:MAG: biosynthetic arginine decarboxylase [Spirochaetales bacterium]|nr:biosynthetic arginine decarboxylase [Spirochaetales bacterium]